MPTLSIDRLHHANVVVHDLRATARNYAQVLGITTWDVHHWTPDRLTHAQAFGSRAAFGYSTATGSNSNGVTFRLVQPTHGFSTFTEFLITRGEGVHSLCLGSSVESNIEPLTIAQAATLDGAATSVMLDTREQLGGFRVELESGALPAANDRWDLSADGQRPDAVEWLANVPKIGHFGIAVSNVVAKLPHYANLLGVERWSGLHFLNAPGSLEHSTYLGQRVDNAWFLAITDVADFGFELLQGTREPTDYRQTVERVGQGIHHVLVRRGVSAQEWSALQSWMASMQVGIVMSGRVRSGAAEFFYLDTRRLLGYLLEVIVTYPEVDPDAGPPMVRYDLDFSSRV